MRPRRLRVKGYTAFVEEVDLDFDGLDLFAITGPTGAGKTSLLQAMTIALYGRAPKLADDLRQLISPMAEQSHFHFEFQAHGCVYRIVRVMSRSRPTTVALEAQGDDGGWTPLARGVREANARVEQILGLDFDSFTKVVLLPQNEFDAFLRGKPEERRSILTRLLSLEIYGRIQQRANQVSAEARTRADVLTGLLERDYADATQEDLDALAETRATAEAAASTSTVRLAALEGAAAAALEVRQRRAHQGAASAGLALHERALVEAHRGHTAAAAVLADAERAVHAHAERLAAIPYDADRHLQLAGATTQAARLNAVIGALADLDAAEAAGRDSIAGLTRHHDETVDTVAGAEQALGAAGDAERRRRADREEQGRHFGDRSTIAGLIEREKQYRDDRGREKDVQRALERLTAREAELSAECQDIGPRHRDAREHVLAARRTREESERNLEALRTLQGTATGIADRLAELSARAERSGVEAERAKSDAERRHADFASAEAARQAAEALLRAAEDEVHRLDRAHAAHALRGSLVVGESCPVCLATVAGLPAGEQVADLDDARRGLEHAREQLDRARRREQGASTNLATADEAHRASVRSWEEARSERDRLAAELREALLPELRDDPLWPEILESRVEAAAGDRTLAGGAFEAAQRRLAEIEADLARIAGELETLPARIDEQRLVLLALRGRCDETEQLLAALLGRPPGADSAAELAAIDARLREADEALVSAAAAVQQARDRMRDAQALATGAARDLDAEIERARRRGREHAQLIREHDDIHGALEKIMPGCADIGPAIATALAELVDARTRREAIARELETSRRDRDRAERAVDAAAVRIAGLGRQLEDLRQREQAARDAMDAAVAALTERMMAIEPVPIVEGDEHDQLTAAVRRARDDRDAAVRRSATLAAEEQALAEKVGRAGECRDQREGERSRAEVARELGLLLGANNLQTYVLADAMRVLVEDGSLHLQRLSDGRYRLQAEDLDFHVVDAWNGDAVRSVKTLSGGETFLTSLALALALAERLADLAAGAHGHEALESLFIDDGFGALDAEETLETVIQAIEALQAHDRLVGIVTHLTPLAERMPAQIRVRKAPEGSRVEIVR